MANKISVWFSFPHLDSARRCISTLLSQDPKFYLGLLFKQNKPVSSFLPSLSLILEPLLWIRISFCNMFICSRKYFDPEVKFGSIYRCSSFFLLILIWNRYSKKWYKNIQINLNKKAHFIALL